MRTVLALATITLAAVSPAALSANAAPLGLELGVATLADVQKNVGSRSRLGDHGINKYTGGPMLRGDGEGLGIEGLSEVVFVFDRNQKLSAVLMTLPKGGFGDENFTRTLGMLAGKYKLQSKQVPFVGDKYAKLRQGDSIVEIDAPHMSFTMSVRYLTNQMQADFAAQNAADNAERQRRQSSAL
jgi:hypothetical protein